MLTDEIIKQYTIEPSKIIKHPFYEQSVEVAKKLKNHSKGKFPADIIDVARPNETAEQKKYRKDVFTPVTKTYFSKVVSTIGKIGRAEDWKIEIPEQDNVAEGETFKDYTCTDFPNFDSVPNWFFSLQLGEMCDDPNGVIAVMPYPKKDNESDSEKLKPFPFWFSCESVIDFREGEFAVLRSKEKSVVSDGKNNFKAGLVYYIIDSDSWAKVVQVGIKDKYTFSYEIQDHWIGSLPCFKIGGIIEEFENGEMLYDSFIGDCLPFWDEALRRYSDQQVQMVLNVHSEKWEIEDSPCKTCKGTGEVASTYLGSRGNVKCGSCNGSGGATAKSPFNVKLIKVQQKTGVSDSTPIPTPPMGYIQKPIEETKFIHDQVKENIKSGLSAINMEFLMSEPELNSGVAKTLDRQEMNAFFYNIARHIVHNVLNPTYYYLAKWRYGLLIPEDQIKEMLPEITVPTEFDILTQDLIAQRLASAKTAGASPSLLGSIQVQWAKKEFGEDSEQVEMLEDALQLDPLPGKTDDEKMTILSNKGTTLDKYILSCNLQSFLFRAYSEYQKSDKEGEEEVDFCDRTYSEKMDILQTYIEEIKAASQSNVVPIVDFNKRPRLNAG
jgi:hypothetical protein